MKKSRIHSTYLLKKKDSMIVGLDFNGTITKNPKLFKRLSAALLAAGYPVYIITAVRASNVSATRQSITKSKVPHTAIEIVVFREFEEIPELKLRACQRLGVKLMIDDMPHTCELLAKHKILTLKVC